MKLRKPKTRNENDFTTIILECPLPCWKLESWPDVWVGDKLNRCCPLLEGEMSPDPGSLLCPRCNLEEWLRKVVMVRRRGEDRPGRDETRSLIVSLINARYSTVSHSDDDKPHMIRCCCSNIICKLKKSEDTE